jgi:hypothetical protein
LPKNSENSPIARRAVVLFDFHRLLAQSPELFFAYVSEHPQEFGTLPNLDDA